MDEKEKELNTETPKEKQDRLSFQDYSKKIEEAYKGEAGAARRYEHVTVSASTLRRIANKENLKTLLNNSLERPWEAANVSSILQATDANYAKLISYFSDMFHIRYVVTPVLLDRDTKIASKEYLEKYHEMMEVVDGLNLETLVPEMLEEVFLNGAVYPYLEKSSSSKTVMATLLPAQYCRTVLKTNYGTNLVEFNYEYFDQFSQGDIEEVLNLFPKEFATGYSAFKTDKIKWKPLNPKFSTSIYKNVRSLPPFVNTLDGILEYEMVREHEQTKSQNELNKILTHRIPIEEGRPVFDLKEVISIQKAISKVTSNHEGLETISVFGDTELLSLQEEGKVENKRITQAYNTIFNSAGLNANLFSAEQEYALKLSQSIDKAMVWRLVKQINLFVNLSINNLYKFKPLQTEIRILPITVHDEKEQVEFYRANAEFGISKLDAVVAAGVKQKHLTDMNRLELELNLSELLKPLQSTHTVSGTVEKTDKEGAEEKNKEGEEKTPVTEE